MKYVLDLDSVPFRLWLFVYLAVGAVLGCQPVNSHQPANALPAQTDSITLSPLDEGGVAMTVKLTSQAFSEGERIPPKYTGDGEDLSPPLAWMDIPEGTQAFALICDDPDAPTAEPWVHWIIYNLPGTITSLPEDVAKPERLQEPKDACQGKNSWSRGQTIGYRGPAPPPGHGTHHYHFTLYALDTQLDLQPGLTKTALLRAIEGHVLGKGKLIGTYSR